MTDYDISEIKRRARLVDYVGARVALKRKGSEYVGLCPFHNEKTPSFTVSESKGFYHCFGCGAHGDVIGFVMETDGLSFAAAAKKLSEESGIVAANPAAAAKRQAETERAAFERARVEAAAAQRKIQAARKIWHDAKPAAGTQVEPYLSSRDIDLLDAGGIPPTIRFAYLKHSPTGLTFPTMVAAVQRRGGIVGIHRTALKADGSGKAAVSSPKMMLGACYHGATRLSKYDPDKNDRLAICEGIETGLSAVEAYDGALPVWAALSLGNIGGGGVLGEGQRAMRDPHPTKPDQELPTSRPDMARPGIWLPDTVKTVVLITDSDSGDQAAADVLAERARRRWQAEGRVVIVASPGDGKDLNDEARG